METRREPDEVRQLVLQVFVGLGAEPAARHELTEMVLIDQGRCVARSYAMDGLMAMWLFEVGLVQFYDADGNMLRTLSLGDRCETRRRAA
jgi:hypothetical protein